jgi:NAD+ synthase (glutamine-hydrolysing)
MQPVARPVTLAVVQFAPRKGDVAANLARIGRLLAEATADAPRPDVVHFAETVLSGYFVEGGVREVARAVDDLALALDASYREACRAAEQVVHAVDVVIGFYEEWRAAMHNSVACIAIGAADGAVHVRHIHRKLFLPTYGLFDEERFVERGTELRAFDAPWGRGALLVCEDAWHSLSGTIAALDGAQLVFVSSAAPARGAWPRTDLPDGPASTARWERLLREMAEEHGVFTSLCNLVGTEGGKRFFGSSLVCGPHGDVRLRLPVWDEAIRSLTLELGDLVRARADAPLLSDLRVALPHLLETVSAVRREQPSRAGGVGPVARTVARGAPPEQEATIAKGSAAHPFRAGDIRRTHLPDADHGGPASLDLDPALAEQWLVGFLKEEFARRGFTRAVVGLSGGVDSALTATLAARALGAANVTAIRLPYRTSSAESLAHAQLVIDQLGINAQTVDISPAVDGYLASMPDADATRRGNVMARQRMIVLFDQAAALRALPTGTGNKTERLFGYYTWHADDSPPINPIGDLYKSQVWALARYVGVPDVIIDKPATADLVVGQTDEGDLGIRYARADQILNALLHGLSPSAIEARGFTADEIAIVQRRLNATHWKRRLPAVAMLSSTAIGESYLRPVDY